MNTIHENDKQNQIKWRKMERRKAAGTLHPNCKWAKRHG